MVPLNRRLRISKVTFWADGCLRPHQGRTWEDVTGRKPVTALRKTKSAAVPDSGFPHALMTVLL